MVLYSDTELWAHNSQVNFPFYVTPGSSCHLKTVNDK